MIWSSSAAGSPEGPWPPHLELLGRWGVLPEMERRGAGYFRYNQFCDNDGQLLLRHDLSFYRSSYYRALVLEHPEIEESLLEVAGGHPCLTVWRGVRFDGLSGHDGTGVTVHLHREGQELRVRAAWVVGADGRQSKVREAAGIASAMRPHPYEMLMTYVPRQPQWRETCVRFVGPRGFAGLFMVNGPFDRLALPLPTGTFPAFMQKAPEERQAEIARRAASLRDVPVQWDLTHSYKLWAHHAPTYQRGRVILMGDAIHTFTPMLGMGMNLALEEAETLAPLLAQRRRLAALDEGVLRRAYEGRRRARTHRILTQSTRQGGFQVAGSPLFQQMFRASLRLINRLPALYKAGLRYTFA